jgi:hypothetical protein
MKFFEYYLMREGKYKGSVDKWVQQEDIEAVNRKKAAIIVRDKLDLPRWTEHPGLKSKDGQWKLRLVGQLEN